MADHDRIIHPANDYATREERALRERAETYRRDPFSERLLGLSAKAEAGNLVAAAELDALAPSVRMSLGFYANARAAAVELKMADSTTGELR